MNNNNNTRKGSGKWTIGYLPEYNDKVWKSSTKDQFRGEQNAQRVVPFKIKNNTGNNFLSDYQDERTEYVTETMAQISKEKSSLSKSYQRQKPAFDRIEACRTNYKVNGEDISTKSTNQGSGNQFETTSGSTFTPLKGGFYGDERKRQIEQFNLHRKDLGTNFSGLTFQETTEARRDVGDKKCFDRPAPRDPAGFKYNILTGQLDKNF